MILIIMFYRQIQSNQYVMYDDNFNGCIENDALLSVIMIIILIRITQIVSVSNAINQQPKLRKCNISQSCKIQFIRKIGHSGLSTFIAGIGSVPLPA